MRGLWMGAAGVALCGGAWAQSVEKCSFASGVVSMPNYVIPITLTGTGTVVDTSVSTLNSFGTATVVVMSSDYAGPKICGYGIGADRCGAAPGTSGGSGWLPNGAVLGLRSISNTAMVGIKVGGAIVSGTYVGVGLCAL